MKGYVYIISNKAMPGLCKVGYTMKDPHARAEELNSTGVPLPYDVDYEILVDNPYELEQKCHIALSSYREGKEWFRCPIEICIYAIRTCNDSQIYHESFVKQESERKFIQIQRENEERIAKEKEEEAKRLEEKKRKELDQWRMEKKRKIDAQIRKENEERLSLLINRRLQGAFGVGGCIFFSYVAHSCGSLIWTLIFAGAGLFHGYIYFFRDDLLDK